MCHSVNFPPNGVGKKKKSMNSTGTRRLRPTLGTRWLITNTWMHLFRCQGVVTQGFCRSSLLFRLCIFVPNNKEHLIWSRGWLSELRQLHGFFWFFLFVFFSSVLFHLIKGAKVVAAHGSSFIKHSFYHRNQHLENWQRMWVSLEGDTWENRLAAQCWPGHSHFLQCAFPHPLIAS